MKMNHLTDYYKSVFFFFFFFVLFRGIINILYPCLHNFPLVFKPRVRLSLFLAVCLVLCSRSFSFYFKRGLIPSKANYTFYLQQGAGNYEDSEESDFSQESEASSQGTESSQEEETENLEPWSRILDEAEKRHKIQLDALINQYQENGDSENVARSKAVSALVPVYRKELRKVLLENLQWMRAMKKDPTFKKVMETKKSLKTQKDLIGWNRRNLPSIRGNSYSIDCTKSSPFYKIKTKPTMNVMDFFFIIISWTFVLLHFNKNCKQPNFKCVD